MKDTQSNSPEQSGQKGRGQRVVSEDLANEFVKERLAKISALTVGRLKPEQEPELWKMLVKQIKQAHSNLPPEQAKLALEAMAPRLRQEAGI